MTDRELDALVAEKVMGWVKSSDEHGDIYSEQSVSYVMHYRTDVPHGMRNDSTTAELPFFSSQIAAAWTVVDHMRYNGSLLELEEEKTGWWARFSGGEKDLLLNQQTAPMAICLAALKAAGVPLG